MLRLVLDSVVFQQVVQQVLQTLKLEMRILIIVFLVIDFLPLMFVGTLGTEQVEDHSGT